MIVRSLFATGSCQRWSRWKLNNRQREDSGNSRWNGWPQVSEIFDIKEGTRIHFYLGKTVDLLNQIVAGAAGIDLHGDDSPVRTGSG